MMAYTPRALTSTEVERLASLTQAIADSGDYPDQVAAIKNAWSASKLGTAREAAMAARPRQDRCVYCQDNQGREVDHLRPKTLHPLLGWCWTNHIPACSTCGGADHKGARDAILDDSQDSGWQEVSRPRRRRGDTTPVSPPTAGPTAWWNPRLADPLRAMRLDIVDDSFQFLVTAVPGTADYARITWTLRVLRLNRRQTLVRQRRSAYHSYLEWLDAVADAKAVRDNSRINRLRADLTFRNQPVVWVEMKRQRGALPAVDALLNRVPEVISW